MSPVERGDNVSNSYNIKTKAYEVQSREGRKNMHIPICISQGRFEYVPRVVQSFGGCDVLRGVVDLFEGCEQGFLLLVDSVCDGLDHLF